MKILNYGSLNYDYVYSVEHFVMPGETIKSKGMEKYLGGKGLNQSIALARAGAKVYHAGMIGQDGAWLLDACKENKVRTDFIREVKGVSGHAIIQVNQLGENSIILFEGANGRNTDEHIKDTLDAFDKEDLILLQNEINGIEEITRIANQKGIKIILNPSPFNERLTDTILKRVSMFIMNEVEGYQITGEKEPQEIIQRMQQSYPHAEVVLTLGSAGCIYSRADEFICCSAYQVPVIDTTAAGDTFTGYFIASLQKGFSIKASLEEASVAAALAVMKKGAVTSIPFWEQVNHAEFRKEIGRNQLCFNL